MGEGYLRPSLFFDSGRDSHPVAEDGVPRGAELARLRAKLDGAEASPYGVARSSCVLLVPRLVHRRTQGCEAAWCLSLKPRSVAAE